MRAAITEMPYHPSYRTSPTRAEILVILLAYRMPPFGCSKGAYRGWQIPVEVKPTTTTTTKMQVGPAAFL